MSDFDLLSFLNVSIPDKPSTTQQPQQPQSKPSRPPFKLSTNISRESQQKQSSRKLPDYEIMSPKSKPPPSQQGSLSTRSEGSVVSFDERQIEEEMKPQSLHFLTTYEREFSPNKKSPARGSPARSPARGSPGGRKQEALSPNEEVEILDAVRNLDDQLRKASEEDVGKSSKPTTPQSENQESFSKSLNQTPEKSFTQRPSSVNRSMISPLRRNQVFAPHTVRISEFQVEEPGMDKIIYEVHDVEIPDFKGMTEEAIQRKKEERQRELDEDRQYLESLQKDSQLYFQSQKDMYLKRKQKLEDEYKEWQHRQDERKQLERQKQTDEQERLNAQLREKQELARREHEQEVNRTKEQREQYARDLERQIKQKELQRKKEMEFDRAPTSTSGIMSDSLDLQAIQERLDKRKELIGYWNKQLKDKATRAKTMEETERQQFNKQLSRDLQSLQEEISQSQRERQLLKDQLKKEWQRSVQKKELQKSQERARKERERQALIADSLRYNQEQRDLTLKRHAQMEKQKNEMDERLKEVQSYRDRNRLFDKQLEADMLARIKLRKQRRKLYRDIRTKRLLRQSEVDRLLPGYR